MGGNQASKAVDAYIASAPAQTQPALHAMRAIIRAAAPQATETIAYGMPAYKGKHSLVYFAANKAHLGFYPTPSGIARFQAELSAYKTSKGAVQFPYTQPLPEALIRRIVEFRVKEDAQQG